MPDSATLTINRQTVVRNILALFSGSMVSQGAAAITLFLMARALGPDQYGQYTSALTLTAFIGIFFNLGLDLWLLHEGGRNPQEIDQLSGSLLVIRLAAGIFWVSLFSIIAPLLQSDTFSVQLLRLGALFTWLNSIFATGLTAFRAILKNKISAAQDAAFNISILIATLALFYYHSASAVNFLTARIMLQIAFLTLMAVQIQRWVGFRPQVRLIKDALVQFPAYLSSDFLASLFMRMDILLVAFILTRKDAGLYSPAVGLINTLFLIPNAVYSVIVPVLSNQFHNDPQRAWKTVKNSLLVLAAIGVLLMAGVLALAQVITIFLGQAYVEIRPVIYLLSPVILLHSITYGMATVLVATRQQARRSKVQFAAVLVDLAANLILLPRIGIAGAAISYLLAEVVIIGGYSSIAYQEYRRQQIRQPVS
ncbi:MAG: flippase [Chloroflexota bacterium]